MWEELRKEKDAGKWIERVQDLDEVGERKMLRKRNMRILLGEGC